ncbi:MAG: hypothetical protein ACYCXZ_08555 [Coriobacteriia bacterium]
MSEFAPIRGKCFYWRENLHEDDLYDSRVKKGERRMQCSCFVEGHRWTFTEEETPADCPDRRHCRYYIHFG